MTKRNDCIDIRLPAASAVQAASEFDRSCDDECGGPAQCREHTEAGDTLSAAAFDILLTCMVPCRGSRPDSTGSAAALPGGQPDTLSCDTVLFLELIAEVQVTLCENESPATCPNALENILTKDKKEDIYDMGFDDIRNDSYDCDKEKGCDCGKDGCFKISTQNAEISVPIQITPNTHVGSIDVECCGDPIVCCDSKSCEGTLNFKIRQKLRIKIPIKYTFTGSVGDSKISCDPEKPCYKTY